MTQNKQQQVAVPASLMMTYQEQTEARMLLYRAEATINNLRAQIQEMAPKIQMLELIERLVFGPRGVAHTPDTAYEIKKFLQEIQKKTDAAATELGAKLRNTNNSDRRED